MAFEMILYHSIYGENQIFYKQNLFEVWTNIDLLTDSI